MHDARSVDPRRQSRKWRQVKAEERADPSPCQGGRGMLLCCSLAANAIAATRPLLHVHTGERQWYCRHTNSHTFSDRCHGSCRAARRRLAHVPCHHLCHPARHALCLCLGLCRGHARPAGPDFASWANAPSQRHPLPMCSTQSRAGSRPAIEVLQATGSAAGANLPCGCHLARGPDSAVSAQGRLQWCAPVV